jgi:hypothetical protein
MGIARRTTVAAAMGLALSLVAGSATASSATAVGPAADATDLSARLVIQTPFDPVWVTGSAAAFVEVTNHGETPVVVPGFGIDAEGSPRSDWSLNAGVHCGGELLDPGATCTQSLMYTPTQAWTGTLFVTFLGGPNGATGLTTPVVAKVDDRPPVMDVPPIPAFTVPTLPYALGAGYSDGETDDGTEDVRVRIAGATASALGDWVYPKAWQGARWGEYGGWLAYGLHIGSLVAGVTECFSYRARDSVGNVAAWTAPRCTSLMWDDRRTTPGRGWVRGVGDQRYHELGTWTRATAKGATLVGPTVTTRRIAILGTTCPTCGAVDVYVGTTRLGALSLRGPMKHRALLMLPARATAVHGQIRLVVRTSGRPVIVDALGSRIV